VHLFHSRKRSLYRLSHHYHISPATIKGWIRNHDYVTRFIGEFSLRSQIKVNAVTLYDLVHHPCLQDIAPIMEIDIQAETMTDRTDIALFRLYLIVFSFYYHSFVKNNKRAVIL